MRQTLRIGILFLFLSLSSPVFSLDISEFHPECFKSYGKIDKNFLSPASVYKLDINAQDIVLLQSGKLLAIKEYQGEDIALEYSESFDVLNDNNKSTSLEIDTQEKKVFEIELMKKTQAGRFYFLYDIPVKYHTMKFLISADGKKYDQVSPENIGDFSFQFFKIEFIPLDEKNPLRENIEIRELGFRSKNKTFLFQSELKENVEIYSGYTCSEELAFHNPLLEKPDINTKTPVLYTELFSNPKYNTSFILDRDNDWIEDERDNCVSYYNPLQEDADADGTGNACDDQDRDNFIGYFDNCPNVYNPKQYDVNRNNVGDACEFDKDKDGIYDSLDNAISVANPDQLDVDRDSIGDIIDNCHLYNPTQIDTDQNAVGDTCDIEQQRLKTQDEDKDGILDSQDNCKSFANPDQKDGDEDTVGDVCDICRDLQNPLQEDQNKNTVGDLCEDSDLDGYLGYLDNCMYFTNPDQKDINNDGVGDVCQDEDFDGKVFLEDNCPFVYNPLQENTDDDALGDVCDEKDDRFLESNKYIFIGLMLIVIAIFGGLFFTIFRKLQK